MRRPQLLLQLQEALQPPTLRVLAVRPKTRGVKRLLPLLPLLPRPQARLGRKVGQLRWKHRLSLSFQSTLHPHLLLLQRQLLQPCTLPWLALSLQFARPLLPVMPYKHR